VNAIAGSAAVRRALLEPVRIGTRTLPPPGLVVLAAVGGALLLVVATSRWGAPQDEHAYWLAARRLLAGEPLYDPAATAVTPYAFWYPPIVAQVLAPIAAILPAEAFSWAWTGLLLACLWYLASGRLLVALALVAFVPVAVELWFRNVHLVLAALVAAGMTRSPVAFTLGGAIKGAPALGLVYVALRGGWRRALAAASLGVALLAVSVALSPAAWSEYLAILGSRGPGDVASFVPLPYWVRGVAGLGLVVLGATRPRPVGDALLVAGIVVASPTLWTNALSMLVAIVPLVERRRA
jgi:hypothetical protein